MGRHELSRHARFAEISPEVGALDEEAMNQALADDPAAFELLAAMTNATDERLRAAAIRGVPADDWQVGLDAALTTLSGRVRRQESCPRSADAVIEEIFRKIRATRTADDSPGGDDSPGE